MNLRILYVFTSTNDQPFLDIREFGILPTWPNLVKSPSEVLALICQPPKWSFLVRKFTDFHEKLRWSRFGKYFMAVSKYLLIPLSYWNPKVLKNGGILTTRTPESYLFMGFKHLAAYQYAFENNFDFIVATNSSSFINVRSIEYFLVNLMQNESPFYGGKPLPHTNPRGASGSFYVLDRNAINIILKNKNRWKHSKLDDIALRELANKLNLNFQELNSIDAKSPTEIQSISKEILESSLHFKIGPYFSGGIRKDSENFKLLWDKFNLYS